MSLVLCFCCVDQYALENRPEFGDCSENAPFADEKYSDGSGNSLILF